MRRCRPAARPDARRPVQGRTARSRPCRNSAQDAVEPGKQRRCQRRHSPAARQRLSSIRPGQNSARSQPAASAATARSAGAPLRALMARSSLNSSPCTPSSPRMISVITCRDVVAGQFGIERRIDHMRGHRERQIGESADGREITTSELLRRGGDHRQLEMAVDHRAAMTRQVLDHRRHAAGEQTLRRSAAASSATRRGSAEKERLPMASVMLGRRHVEHRRAIDVDARPRADRGRSAAPSSRAASRPAASILGGEPADVAGRRQRAPLRRTQAHHPAALLVDQDRQAPSPRQARAARRSAREAGARSAQLRWNRMTPAGGSASSSSRSAGVERRPGDPDDGRARASAGAHAALTRRSARR